MAEIPNTIVVRNRFGTKLVKGNGLSHIVVLGAGVSTSVGIPVADNLLENIISFGGPRPIDIVLDFLEYNYAKFTRGGTWYPLAEDVLGMLDIAKDYCSIRSNLRGYRWRIGVIDQVRDRFLRSLSGYLWSFQKARINKKHPLRQFVRIFDKKTAYITFNYDLTLETALSYERIPYGYGIPCAPDGVAIIKPHGSINWFTKTDKFPHGTGKWFDLGEDIACYTSLRPSEGWTDRPPAIIPPAPLKRFEGEVFKKMWTSFSSVAHSGNDIAIVGYSLPEADRLSRFILRRSSRLPNTHKITVINPDNSVSRVYKENVSDSIDFISAKFEDWVEAL